MTAAPVSPAGRRGAAVLAGAIALVAWAGLALNFVDVFGRTGSVFAALWLLVDFFTITTNLAVAVLFTGMAVRSQRLPRPRLVAGLALSMLLVGIVYQLLLQGLYQFTPIAQVADVLLHRVTTVLVPLYWLLAVGKGALTLRDPFLWALYPIVYFVYALLRGAASGHYPCPFMDVARIGLAQAAINAVVIAIGFLATGGALVWLDGMLAGRSAPRP